MLHFFKRDSFLFFNVQFKANILYIASKLSPRSLGKGFYHTIPFPKLIFGVSLMEPDKAPYLEVGQVAMYFSMLPLYQFQSRFDMGFK